MKFPIIALALFTGSSLAMAEYIGMTAELVGVNLLQESETPNYTIRVYAEVEEGARIDGVYGVPDQPMFLAPASGSYFYQSNYGGPTSKSINPAFFEFFPDLEWDSYMTIGALDQTGDPFDNNALNDIGIDWTEFENGGGIDVDDGIWFVTPDDPQGEAINGTVLIAQLTVISTNGQFDYPSFGANFIGHDSDFNAWQAWGELNWIPAPATLAMVPALLLTGTRRRS
ncbi:MAG: hypothetical protein MK089_07505 [Phycisphaerales bacterium]|nr:hypothetical protein [Phycisphaerales bacterium]